MLNDFEQGYENIRSWMDTIETNLQKPIISQNTNELHIQQQSMLVREHFDNEKYNYN